MNLTIQRYRGQEIEDHRTAEARGCQMSRYFLIGIDGKVAFARWSGQFTPEKAKREVEQRACLQTFPLEETFDPQGSANEKDSLPAVTAALERYGMLTLPARLVKPVLWPNPPTRYEAEGIALYTFNRGSKWPHYQGDHGCFICGDGKWATDIWGEVRSPEPESAVRALNNLFNNQGIGETAFSRQAGRLAGVEHVPFTLGACSKHDTTIHPYLFDVTRDHPTYITREIIEAFDSFGFDYFWKYASDSSLNAAIEIARREGQRGFRFF